jgi:uncharacterized membrane-anchored protein
MVTGEMGTRDTLAGPSLSKVPEITAYFWIAKGLTTGMGESTSDFLVHTFNPELVVVAGFAAFCGALWLQFRTPRYIAWVYWLAVAMVGVFGTMAADVVHIGFGVPYAASTAVFAVALAAVFRRWYKSEGTLSIHSITTRAREKFYWAAVVATFALGTAAGDLTAVTLHLGYFSSGLMFAGVICIPALAYWRKVMGPIAAFWFAYVVTRPLGASFADWIGVSHKRGGLNFGAGEISAVLAALLICLVLLFTITHIDDPHRAAMDERDAAEPRR